MHSYDEDDVSDKKSKSDISLKKKEDVQRNGKTPIDMVVKSAASPIVDAPGKSTCPETDGSDEKKSTQGEAREAMGPVSGDTRSEKKHKMVRRGGRKNDMEPNIAHAEAQGIRSRRIHMIVGLSPRRGKKAMSRKNRMICKIWRVSLRKGGMRMYREKK